MPVIVVGNLIVGGAGKTPTAIALVELLRAWGWTPGLVSRGHGRRRAAPFLLDADSAAAATAADCGDEPLLMHRRTGAPVAVARRRREAAVRLLRAHPEIDLVIADDGLQHHALARDIEIVVFDSRGLGNGWTLPAGPLREPPSALWPRGEATPGATAPRRLTLLNGPWPDAPALALPAPADQVWEIRSRLVGAVELRAWRRGLPADPLALQALRGRPVLAAAGIGAPTRFFSMLEAEGLALRRLVLPDHAGYATLPWPDDIADVLVTEKDAVKLQRADRHGTRIWVVKLDFEFAPGFTAALKHALTHALARTADASQESPR